MLSADALAALERAHAPVNPPLPIRSDEESSVGSSNVSSIRSHDDTTVVTEGVGIVRSEHEAGTVRARKSVDKWILAALRSLNCSVSDLVSTSTFEPNDELFSHVHKQLADWRTSMTRARDAGVVDDRTYILDRAPPECVLAKARSWFIEHVNTIRAAHGVRQVDNTWARTLPGVQADAKVVNRDTRVAKASDGSLYHHKHDLAPSYDEMTSMCLVGFTGDVRVDEDVLDACEAGMSIAIYLPTGARGSELRNMVIQSIGYEEVPHESSGTSFECLKLTAFDTKTRDHHLNQFLPTSNPWRCGIGAFGISLLIRVRRYGPPPFGMERSDASWKVIGSSTGSSFDRRLRDVFNLAGVRRQSGDPLTYLGRHFGTRVLQHQGGTAEGGAARRGHRNGTASHHYTETPLQDLLRLMGNDPTAPFVPAHLQQWLFPHADVVLRLLFPALFVEVESVARRQREVDAMRGNSERVRADEHLLSRERMLRGIRLACRTALLCLVARPRKWQQWTILETERSVWQHGLGVRVIAALFAGNVDAVRGMDALASHVRRAEETEIAARAMCPAQRQTLAVVDALQQFSDRQHQRETALIAQQQALFQTLVTGGGGSSSPTTTQMLSVGNAASSSSASASVPPPPTPQVASSAPLAGVRAKRKAQQQNDVAYVSSWPTVADALDYARSTLVPLEREQGTEWRIIKIDKDREDKSRDRQWKFYRRLAVAVGMSSVDALQARLDAAKSITDLFRDLKREQQTMADANAIADRVLGL